VKTENTISAVFMSDAKLDDVLGDEYVAENVNGILEAILESLNERPLVWRSV
jgi:hypothetical protein